MGAFSLVRGLVSGLDEATGNTKGAADLQAANDRDRDNRLQLAVAPLSASLRADMDRLKNYVDANGTPLPQHQADYDLVHNRMANTIGQMRQLYGQKPQGVNPVEAGVGSLLDKLHITNHLKNHVAQVRAENAAKYNDQTNQMTGQYAVGAVAPPNPYLQSEAQMRAAGFSEPDIQQAIRAKAGLIPKDTTEQERFVTSYKQQHSGSTDEDALKAYTKATEKPVASRGMKFDTATGQVVDQDNNNKRYSKGDANLPPEVKSMFDSESSREKIKQDEADKKQKDLWDRLQHTEAFQERMTAIREDIHDREQNLALTSKIPATEANRYTQAQIIQEQTDKIRELLKDPDVTKYMGPIAGRIPGAVASLYSPKVRELFTAQKSLSALLPILHGYRGGVQTQTAFDNMSGNMNVDVKAYQGALKAIDDMAGSIKDQVQGDYPNAPMFAGPAPQGPTMRKNRQIQKGNAAQPGVIVVSPEDMK